MDRDFGIRSVKRSINRESRSRTLYRSSAQRSSLACAACAACASVRFLTRAATAEPMAGSSPLAGTSEWICTSLRGFVPCRVRRHSLLGERGAARQLLAVPRRRSDMVSSPTKVRIRGGWW